MLIRFVICYLNELNGFHHWQNAKWKTNACKVYDVQVSRRMNGMNGKRRKEIVKIFVPNELKDIHDSASCPVSFVISPCVNTPNSCSKLSGSTTQMHTIRKLRSLSLVILFTQKNRSLVYFLCVCLIRYSIYLFSAKAHTKFK